jgi:diketogulonate reductase-like aldo/keto reductase
MSKTVGVANYSLEDRFTMQEELAEYGVPLTINQIEFSVLRRLPELPGCLKPAKSAASSFGPTALSCKVA